MFSVLIRNSQEVTIYCYCNESIKSYLKIFPFPTRIKRTKSTDLTNQFSNKFIDVMTCYVLPLWADSIYF